jgi:hypothetical protein
VIFVEIGLSGEVVMKVVCTKASGKLEKRIAAESIQASKINLILSGSQSAAQPNDEDRSSQVRERKLRVPA